MQEEQYKVTLYQFNLFMKSYVNNFTSTSPQLVLSDLNNMAVQFLNTFMNTTQDIYYDDGTFNKWHYKYLSDQLGYLNKSFKEWKKYLEGLELLNYD